MLYRYFIGIVCITLLSLFSFFSISKVERSSLKGAFVSLNNPPVVKFITPKNHSKVKRNTLVPYSIEVSDKEDGESKYKEIAGEEVFLEIKTFSDYTAATAYLKSIIPLDPLGFSAIKTSDCFNCHNQKTKLIGPSFEEISKRYDQSPATIDKISEHVRNGLSGSWGDAVMPAHPELSQDVAKKMVQWILENGHDPTIDYHRGMQGTFWFRLGSSKPGVYVLTASYNDHGDGERPETSLKGSERILITEESN